MPERIRAYTAFTACCVLLYVVHGRRREVRRASAAPSVHYPK